MKEIYTAPEVERIGFVSEQPVAAFEFDELLLRGAGKQQGALTSQTDIPIIIDD